MRHNFDHHPCSLFCRHLQRQPSGGAADPSRPSEEPVSGGGSMLNGGQRPNPQAALQTPPDLVKNLYQVGAPI